MKNVRVFYKKLSRLKFVSHLDMNRFMSRMLKKSGLPVWYTEGFNTHIYITFALPLSLGFESEYDVMDFKVTDDNLTNEDIVLLLKRVMPPYLEIISAAEPLEKISEVAFAEFKIMFPKVNGLAVKLDSFLLSDEILVTKKNKKGREQTTDISKKINKFKITESEDKIILNIVLSAGNDNLNPTLLLDTFSNNTGFCLPYYSVLRTKILDKNLDLFK